MNLRQVRTKIKSFGNVKKITKAMQLVSAVKMKKAQTVAIEGRPYREGLDEIIRRVLPYSDTSQIPLMVKSQEKLTAEKDLIILITSNKGLCGGFNLNLFRLLMKEPNLKKTEFLVIGKKGATFVSTVGSQVVADFSSATPVHEVGAIYELAEKYFMSGTYASVSLVYNKFISTSRSEAVRDQLFPIRVQDYIVKQDDEKLAQYDYLIEPNSTELLKQLINSYLEEKIRGAILNSEAAEHSSRMIAMKNATDNATELIGNLTSLRNKLRQQKITYELLDMITAAESVK